MRIVSRAEWGARPPKSRSMMPVPSPRLWLHHTAAEQHGAAGVRSTQNYHMDTNGWSDIAYSFLVDDDGTAYEGRGPGVVGAHTSGDNSSSHAICAMGNYQERKPPSALLLAITDLLGYGHSQGWWPADFTGGHQQAAGASTACPGRYLMDALPGINAGQPPPPPPIAKDEHMSRTAPDMRREPLSNSREPFFRWLDGVNPTHVRVLGYNGAQLLWVNGDEPYGVPFMDIHGLAAPVLGIEVGHDGRVVLHCEDGGCIDVSKR